MAGDEPRAVMAALADAGRRLVDRLSRQRWYGDKGRPVARWAVPAAVPLGDGFVWAAVDLAFGDCGSSRYALPLRVATSGSEVESFAPLPEGALVDATADPGFARRLLDLLARGATVDGIGGTLRFASLPGLDGPTLAGAWAATPTVGGMEQSNTSVRYGEAAVVKVFRRLQPGPNPDEEIGRFLQRRNFRDTPAPLGGFALLEPDGSVWPGAWAQAFVPNLGDGWQWTLERLAVDSAATSGEVLPALAGLGRTTADLHIALAGGADEPAFAPEPATAEDIAAVGATARANLSATLAALQVRDDDGPSARQTGIARALSSETALAERLAGFAAERGLARIRVHGDFHLGQTLRRRDGGWAVIDFEGEPARPVEERRRKTSALKDVAGMLRSFAYVRGALTRLPGAAPDAPALATWERAARRAFLGAYRERIGQAPVALVPADDAAFAQALAAWETDKALYEVRYELANRPDWLPIPLAGLTG